MMLADTVGIFLVIVGLLIAFPALWLLCRGLWPGAVVACGERNRRGMVKSFFVGLPFLVILIIAMGISGKLPGPVGQLSPLFLLSVFFLYASVGVAGIATMLGGRLPSPADEARTWNRTLRGSIVLVLSFLFPILGWFLLLPVSLIVGFGTLTRVLLTYKKVPATPPPLPQNLPPAMTLDDVTTNESCARHAVEVESEAATPV